MKAPTANIARTQSLRDITTSPEDGGTSGHQAGGEDSSWEALELQPPWISEGGGLEYQLKAQPPQAEDERMQSGGLKDQLEARPLQAEDERMQSGGLEDQFEARPPQAQDEGMQTGGLEDLLMARPLQVEDERMQSGGLEDQLMARPLQAEDERMRSGGLEDQLMARPLQAEDERMRSGGLEDLLMARPLQAEDERMQSGGLEDQLEARPPQAQDEGMQSGGLEDQLEARPLQAEDERMQSGGLEDQLEARPPQAQDEGMQSGGLEDQLEARPLQAEDERMQSGGLEDQLMARPPQAQDEGMQSGGLKDQLEARPLQAEDERMQSGGLEDQLEARPQAEDERGQSGGLEDQQLEAESGSLLSEDLGEQSEVCPLQGGGLSQQEPHLAGGESSWEDQLMCLGPKRDISTTHKADDETTHNVSLEDQHPIPERDKDHIPAHPQVMVCGPEEDTGWLEGCPPVFLHPAEENLLVEGREESRSLSDLPQYSEEDNSEWVESGESPISQRESFETAASSFDGGWKETSPSPVTSQTTSSCGSTHSSLKVGTPECMENFFCEHLMRYGGQMQVERLWQHYRNAFQLPAQPTASREFFEQRPHLFAISERSNVCFIRLMKTNYPMGAQPIGSMGSEKMVQFFCDYLKKSGNYSSFCHLCTAYRETHRLTEMQCWLDKTFFLLRPNIFQVLEKEGSCQIKLKDPGKISPTKVKSEEETEMVRFFRNYLRRLGHEAGFVRLCKAYRSAYRIPLSMLRLDKKFFVDRPHLFVVRESQGSCLIKLNLELDNKQVEKAVISYLSENNRMALLSDLKNNKKLRKVCQDCHIQLTRSFVLSRSQLFEVVQRDFDASINDCFVILKSRAVLKEYASSSSGKRQPRSAPSSGQKRQQHSSSQCPHSSELGSFQTRNSIAKQQ